MPESNEVELLDETVSKRDVINSLLASGMVPSLISQSTKTPIAVIQTLVRTRYAPADEELETAVRMMQMNAIRFVNRELVHGTRESKLALSKIIIGRMLSKTNGGEANGIDEMRTAWVEIQEEQRSPSQVPVSNVSFLPHGLDVDDDEDEFE